MAIPDPRWYGSKVLVTGASGFIGLALTRALLASGRHVVALAHEPAPGALVELGVEVAPGDLRDAASVQRAMTGCSSVFHVAALYRFWARDPDAFYAVNVEGTRNVLRAARECGVERLVYTSTVGTLGLEGACAERPATESSYPQVNHLFGAYKRSKYVAEHEVLRAAAEGLPVTLVLPTFPLGPGDRAPTPSGRLVLDFLNGHMPGYVDTVLNVAHVEDVAYGHVLAHDVGAPGRSYILGGENLTLREILLELAHRTGLPEPWLRVPRAVSLTAAWLSDTVEGRLLHRQPHVPLEAARMATTRMAFDDSRARTELGYSPRPAAEAIAASARWFLDNGFVTNRRLVPPDGPRHRPGIRHRAVAS
jgi:dihydroflavonol-4-reductase